MLPIQNEEVCNQFMRRFYPLAPPSMKWPENICIGDGEAGRVGQDCLFHLLQDLQQLAFLLSFSFGTDFLSSLFIIHYAFSSMIGRLLG